MTVVKIGVRNALAAALGWATRLPDRIRVLTFHDVADNSNSAFAIGRRRFAEFLDILNDQGYQTVQACALAAERPGNLQRARVIILTFDDGLASHADCVAGLLDKRGMVGTFFIISSLVAKERTTAKLGEMDACFLCWRDLTNLESAGFEVGSHSHTHAWCGSLTPEELRREIGKSKEVLEGGLSRALRSFAYPFGRRGSYSAQSRRELKASGFTLGFTQEGVRSTIDTDLFAFPRISIDRYDTLRTFKRKVLGSYEFLEKLRTR